MASSSEQNVSPWLENWIQLAKVEELTKKLNKSTATLTKFNNILDFSIKNFIVNNEVNMSMVNRELLILKMSNLSTNINKEESSSEENDDSLIHRALSLALNNSQKLNMYDLESSEVPAEILSIDQGNGAFSDDNPPEIERLLDKKLLSRSNSKDYYEAYTTMIHLEEAAQSEFISQFNTKNIRLRYTDESRQFCIRNDRFVAKMAEAVEESILDSFTLKPVFSDEEKSSSRIRTNVSIYGQIKGINKDFIYIEINDQYFADYVKENCRRRSFDIYFQLNIMTFQLQHNALKWMRLHNLFDQLINNPKYSLLSIMMNHQCVGENYELRGELGSKLNQEQKTAAINIVQAENSPLPYLLFGPAGTGKTRTLVAAIEEIVRSTEKSVLVCANSNSACDEIAERLINVLRFGEMFRMYAKTHDNRKISDDIKPISNWCEREFQFPSLKFLYRFRVIVCTLSTAGCITRAYESPGFDSSHFSHIIIDECASTHETVTMVPIAGLCTHPREIKSSIVLAGDPKQLDAVTKSGYAGKLGFKTSFMEHLFEKRLYKRNALTGKFNQKYITQLVKNYRSHPAILEIPNKLFYDNKLEAKAPDDITNWFIDSKLLPSKKFPLILKNVSGICTRSNRDFSLFNKKEVDAVIDYIKQLLGNDNLSKVKVTQSDIGVVTPYKLQCKVIARECRKNGFENITIGTAEVFQGQEKPIMIVSTVRTGGKLGFVKDPRRMNVIITRAKALLIIVGDYKTLLSDENWNELVNHCCKNGAIVY